jgi:uncharacterized membrane-anchored protein
MASDIRDGGPAATWLDRLLGQMRNRERGVLLGAAGFQVVVLVAMIVLRGMTVLTGQTVLLQVVPVDPRDLFRGDYVILGYEFSRPRGMMRAGVSAGTPVYVSLVPEPGGQHWHVETISAQRPAGGLYLQGRYLASGRVECGIESYFVQEGQGHRYEQAVRSGRLYAEIAVDRNGQAVVRGLRIE